MRFFVTNLSAVAFFVLDESYNCFNSLSYGVTHSLCMHHIINPLNANPEKWSNTLKQIVGNLPTICLSMFDHFMNLTLKGLNKLRDDKASQIEIFTNKLDNSDSTTIL